MSSAKRSTIAVVAGIILWSGLWVGGAAIARAITPAAGVAGEPLTETVPLIGYIVFSVFVSLVSGYATARMAEGHMRAVHIAAGILLLMGIAIEGAGWRLAPAWYHIVFLVLIVPAFVLGGRARVT